jgi:hypothetical protein
VSTPIRHVTYINQCAEDRVAIATDAALRSDATAVCTETATNTESKFTTACEQESMVLRHVPMPEKNVAAFKPEVNVSRPR